jgi:hypothetical protein
MRAWIASGKEDWRRPLLRPSTKNAITFGGALLPIVLPDETPVRSPCGRVVCTACGLIGADVRPQTKRSNFRWEQGAM